MLTIRARAPLRLGLAGGGTDVSPYCDLYGGYVLNATIDRYAYTVINLIDDSAIKFVAADYQKAVVFGLDDVILLDGVLNLHKAVYKYFIENHNNNIPIAMELSTYCDAPAGSGLGSSSTLVVAMIRAFVELFNLPFDDYKIAKLAFQIERVDCKLEGGRQDQFSATFGGFNFMEFYAEDRSIINPLRIKNWIICELEASLLLYFTGVSRESAKIIADQSNNIENGSLESLNSMHQIKDEALKMKESLLRADFKGVVEAMQRGWESKKKSAKSVSNNEIDDIYTAALKSGALAGKVSGAGGGGFMWFFVPTERRMELIRTLKQFGGEVSNCHFTKNGTQAWRIQ